MSRPHEQLLRAGHGFGPGLTRITDERELGIEFAILRLAPGERHRCAAGRERALLLLRGEVELAWASERAVAARASFLDDDPTVLHLPAGVQAELTARAACELALLATANDRAFPPRLFRPGEIEVEQRGAGLLDGTAHRIVRTVFDRRNRPASNLVLGEVVTLPGRWSSYPPHHHPQPELYHYRFSDPRGYGHGELGDEVLKLRDGDTLLIRAGRDHAQVAAPGYAMYYLWAIRHLDGAPYTTPEFSEQHRWLLDPEAAVWRPDARTTEAKA
jgi:5-deoxy-glucuronate isomerase